MMTNTHSRRRRFVQRFSQLVSLTALLMLPGSAWSLGTERSQPASHSAPLDQTCPPHTKPIRSMKEGERGYVALNDYIAYRYPARIGLLASACVSDTRTPRYPLAIETRRLTIAMDPASFPLDLRDIEFTPLGHTQGHR